MARLTGIFLDSFFPMLKAGILYTVPLTILSFSLGLLLGLVVAIIRISNQRFLNTVVSGYVWIIRGTPLLVQLFIIFYGLPKIGLTLDAYLAAIIGFTLNVGAYSSETIRAAILSVDRGQWEASHALGLSKIQTLRLVVFPQAFKVAIPPLFNSFISHVKDTSLAAAITYTELFRVAQQITARTYEPLLLYCEAALIYLMFCTVLTALQNKLEKYFRRSGI